MARSLLAPRWLAVHAAVAAAVAAFVFLGFWQLGAYQDERIQREMRAQPAAELSRLASPGQPLPPATAGRNVRAAGSYLGTGQVLVPGRLLGNVSGWWVVTPLAVDDRGGAVVTVLRGWVGEPDDVAAEVPPGRVVVRGVLRPEEDADAAVPLGRDLRPGEAAYISGRTVPRAGMDPARRYPGLLQLTDQQPQHSPAPVPVPPEQLAATRGAGLWQNLSYAAQWWLFAVAALAFWMSAVRSYRRGALGSEAGRTQETTLRSATNDANGTVPASSTSTDRPSGQRSR